MANKRILKKQISRVCGDLAAETVIAAHCVEGMDTEKVHKIVNEIAALQVEALDRVSFSFDKSHRDFPSEHEYRKARKKYNAEAFATLKKDFGKAVETIVKAMNEALPEECKKANVEALKKK